VPRTWLVVAALAVSALCWRIGAYPLLEPDEGRNAEVAREMARSGDFILPHLNGLPYLDKPAPYFAAVALAFRAFGETETAARLPTVLFTLATGLLVWRLGRRMDPDGTPARRHARTPARPHPGTPARRHAGTAEIAAVALLTTPLVLAFSRTVIFDAMLMLIETATLYCAWRVYEGNEERGARSEGEGQGDDGRRWAAGAWALMGIGAITKGPVAIVVPLLIVLAFALLGGLPLRRFFALRAWPWLLVTGLPWFIAVTLRRPDFPHYAFISESLQRVGTTAHGRAAPWWFFLAVAPAAAFPWTIPALAGLRDALRGWAQRRAPSARAPLFLAAWALVPLVFFSLSQSKLSHYYLPALPGVALAAGLVLARGAPRGRTWRTAAAAAVALAVLAAATLAATQVIGRVRLPPGVAEAVPGFAWPFALVLAGATALAFVAARRCEPWRLAAALALPVPAIAFLGLGVMRAVGAHRSSHDLDAAMDRRAPHARVVLAGTYPTSLRWYLDRPVLVATRTGRETTSNYIAARLEEFRALPGSTLRPEHWWQDALALCTEPTVFVARRRTAADTVLAARLPLIRVGGADDRHAAYGPCVPAAGGTP
jgi:4-amino-4-deoxy-L-arabinose transferase-like glycosyltransferase